MVQEGGRKVKTPIPAAFHDSRAPRHAGQMMKVSPCAWVEDFLWQAAKPLGPPRIVCVGVCVGLWGRGVDQEILHLQAVLRLIFELLESGLAIGRVWQGAVLERVY